MAVDSIYGFIGARYVLGPGSIVQIGNIPGMNAANIKVDLGVSGMVEVAGFTNAFSSSFLGFSLITGAGSNASSAGPTFGNGYAISTNEIFCANLAGTVYLYTSGNTCTVSIAFGRSQGFLGT